MKLRSSIGVSSLLAAGLMTATLATTGTATADVIGQICNVKTDRSMLVTGPPDYYVGPGEPVRIDAIPNANYYWGHGYALSSGLFLRADIDHSTCRIG